MKTFNYKNRWLNTITFTTLSVVASMLIYYGTNQYDYEISVLILSVTFVFHVFTTWFILDNYTPNKFVPKEYRK